MKLVSYIQDSFQEYENEHSLVLFSYGCSLNCIGCYNKTQVLDPSQIIGDAISVIDSKVTPMHTAVVLLGGEPCIHPDILNVVKHIHSKGLNIKVFTNGMHPNILKTITPYVHAVSIDFKCLNNCSDILGVEYKDTNYLTNIKSSYNTCIHYAVDVEFRTTKWSTLTKQHIEEIKQYIQTNYPDVRHIIQDDFTDQIANNKKV